MKIKMFETTTQVFVAPIPPIEILVQKRWLDAAFLQDGPRHQLQVELWGPYK